MDASSTAATSQRAWLALLPVVLILGFGGVVPLITVVNYSFQDIFSLDSRIFVGFEWYRWVLRNELFGDAFLRQMLFSGLVLLIEVPLGVLIARALPRESQITPILLVVMAVPLLVPLNVVGTIWQVFARPDIGLLGVTATSLGLDFNYTQQPLHAWLTLLAMDVWHWTSLVVLLVYAGLASIPPAYYQAAAIDRASAWQVFAYIELPLIKRVLVIAVLLRLIDSLIIYTEPFVLTGGGPGSSTTFLSQHLSTLAVGQFDLGPAAAFSMVYFVLILTVCWLFYAWVTAADE